MARYIPRTKNYAFACIFFFFIRSENILLNQGKNFLNPTTESLKVNLKKTV